MSLPASMSNHPPQFIRAVLYQYHFTTAEERKSTGQWWKRDFVGACGLFGVVLHPVAKDRVDAMLDGLRLFRLGWSWGGFESLIIPAHPERMRTATRWEAAGPYLRLHVGLEDPQDLIADLEDGLARLGS